MVFNKKNKNKRRKKISHSKFLENFGHDVLFSSKTEEGFFLLLFYTKRIIEAFKNFFNGFFFLI